VDFPWSIWAMMAKFLMCSRSTALFWLSVQGFGICSPFSERTAGVGVNIDYIWFVIRRPLLAEGPYCSVDYSHLAMHAWVVEELDEAKWSSAVPISHYGKNLLRNSGGTNGHGSP